jgi:hypothetical protein
MTRWEEERIELGVRWESNKFHCLPIIKQVKTFPLFGAKASARLVLESNQCCGFRNGRMFGMVKNAVKNGIR